MTYTVGSTQFDYTFATQTGPRVNTLFQYNYPVVAGVATTFGVIITDNSDGNCGGYV